METISEHSSWRDIQKRNLGWQITRKVVIFHTMVSHTSWWYNVITLYTPSTVRAVLSSPTAAIWSSHSQFVSCHWSGGHWPGHHPSKDTSSLASYWLVTSFFSSSNRDCIMQSLYQNGRWHKEGLLCSQEQDKLLQWIVTRVNISPQQTSSSHKCQEISTELHKFIVRVKLQTNIQHFQFIWYLGCLVNISYRLSDQLN